MGDSVGWWEGDALVIDSVGFNDKTWLDRAGLPHSDQLPRRRTHHGPSTDTLVVHIRLTIESVYQDLGGENGSTS